MLGFFTFIIKNMILTGSYQNQIFKEPLSSEEEEYHIKELLNGNKLSREILIEHNLRLVAHIVKKYSDKMDNVDDLISIGTIGLIKGIDSFSKSNGAKITTYCARCIENARQLKRITQEELARTLGVDSCTIKQIENKTYKQLHSTTIITNIIDYLDIRDKIKINDDYLEFILKKKQHEIFDFRIKYNIALIDFANMIDVYPKTIIKWEKDQSTISRKKFEKK